MVPLFVHPSLLLSEPLRPTGQPSQDSLLTPGEAVRVTVLNVLDGGALLLSVKGMVLRATSLIGRLPVGQVVDAHVESRDGQVLLRLDQPFHAAPANPVWAQATDPAPAIRQGGPAEPSRLAELLKTLLPADRPLSSGLASLAASLAAAAERGEVAQQTLARFQALAERVLLAPPQSGTQPTGEDLRRVLLALGLQHEQALLAELNRAGTIASREGAPNLKVLLTALLAEAAADGPVEAVPSLHTEPIPPSAAPSALPTAPASPLYNNDAFIRGRAAVPISGDAARQEPAWPEPPPSGRPAPVRPAGALALPSQSEAEAPWLPERPAVGSGSSSIRAETVRKEEPAIVPVQPQALRGQPKGDEETAQEEESAGPSGASALSGQNGRHELEGAGKGGWMRDAHQVLTMIERTQTLAALNGQAGQPILFELPLAGGGQVWLAVEERPTGGGQGRERSRSYNVVTLLNLDGLGAVRVDTLLTGKRLSARFLLDHAEVRQKVTGYLPALNASLSAKGYHIDLLTTGLGEPELVRGDDVRAKALPRVSLVNRRA